MLRLESVQLLFLHLYPEPLSVVTVLESLSVTLHVPEAEEQVLVGAAPSVMHAHRVVGGNGTVDEGKSLLRCLIAREVTVDD